MMTGGSGTEPFAAEITQVGSAYEGVFTVGGKIYDVDGFYNGANDEGNIFAFYLPLSELNPTVSPGVFPGLTWSGPLTARTYSGGWFLENEAGVRPQAGEFNLERLP